MFNKTKNYLKKTAKGFLSSNRMKTMALMLRGRLWCGNGTELGW
jgi:hypothetical protein